MNLCKIKYVATTNRMTTGRIGPSNHQHHHHQQHQRNTREKLSIIKLKKLVDKKLALVFSFYMFLTLDIIFNTPNKSSRFFSVFGECFTFRLLLKIHVRKEISIRNRSGCSQRCMSQTEVKKAARIKKEA